MKHKNFFKIAFFISMIFSFIVSTSAQTTIFSEAGGGAAPTGWTFNNTNTVNDIDRGSYWLVDATAGENIITATYDLSSYASAQFNVRVATFGSGTANPALVEISYDNGANYTQSSTTATPSSSTYITGGPIVLTETLTSQVVIRISNNGTSGRGVRLQSLELIASGTAGGPNVLLSETSLSGFTYELGSGPSTEQTFTAEGSDLTADITVTAPTDFEVSTTSGSGFGSSVTLPQSGGTVNSTTIYVRLVTGLSVNTYNGTISATSTGATQRDISLSGEVTAPSCASSTTTFPFNGVNGSTNLEHNSGTPPGTSGESCGTNYRVYYVSEPSTDNSGNYLRSNTTTGLIESADWGGEGKFETFDIDVSGVTSININTFGDTDGNPFNAGGEQFQWWYKLDGGAETNFGTLFNNDYQGSLANATETIDVSAVNSIKVGFTFNFNGSGGFVNANVTVTTNTTWTGTNSSSWSDSGNWSNGVPNSNLNVIIPNGLTNYPTVTTAETINSLNIASGATLVATNAGFTVTDNATYVRNLATGGRWYLMSSPVIGEMYDNDWVSANNIPSSTLDVDNRGISWYNNASSDTDSDGASTGDSATGFWRYMENSTSGSFATGRGYGIIRSSSGDITFIGSGIYTSDQSYLLEQGDNTFNLIGNPFTGFITLGTFYTTNNGVIGTTFYTWNGSSYTTRLSNISDSNNQNYEIAPGQGFFVEATSESNVTFEVSDVTHQSTDTFEKNSNTISQVKLNITEGNNERFAKIYYIDGTTTGFDNGYDGKLFGGVSHNLALYSKLVDNSNTEKYQIQSLPNLNHENMVVPIGLIATSGKEITFSSETLNLPTALKVYLEDRENNIVTRLDEANSNYKVTLTENLDGVGRFFLHTRSSALSTDDITLEGVNIYAIDKNTLQITGINSNNASVKVFSILGKKVVDTSFSSKGSKEIKLPSLNTGVYIVQLSSEKGKMNKKIVLE